MPILFQILGVLALVVVGLGALLMSFDRPNKGKSIDHDACCPCFDCQPKGCRRYR